MIHFTDSIPLYMGDSDTLLHTGSSALIITYSCSSYSQCCKWTLAISQHSRKWSQKWEVSWWISYNGI